MRLKVLDIKNIASIEAATIDFTQGLLATQDLFLITGPTGAGKSTLLDAICLALFNNTPRMNNSANDAVDEMSDDDGKLKINNVLHHVRKNAVEASVTLTFDIDIFNDAGDKESRECKAVWKVYRKDQYYRGKEKTTFTSLPLSEKLKKGIIREWYFVDADGVTHKNSEVDKAIPAAIHMNFSQFCKTTMLAQGDFTKFLASKSDDKADILEKLAGTSRYSRTGAEINKRANQLDKDVEVMKRTLDGIVLLSDEQRAEKQQQIKSIKDEVGILSKNQEAIDKKIKLTDDRQKAQSEVEKAKVALSEAQQALQADDVMANIQTINLWDNTDEVRKSIIRLQESKAAEDRNRLTLCIRANDYDTAISGKLAAQKEKSDLEAEIHGLNKQIEADGRFEQMFNAAPVICATQSDLLAHEGFVRDNTPKLKEYDDKIASLNSRIEGYKAKKEQAETQISEIKKKIEANNQELKVKGADTIESEVDQLHIHKSKVSEALNALNAVSDAMTTCDQRKKEADDHANKTELLKRSVDVAKVEYDKADSSMNESKAVYEKTRDSISDHAKVLRAKLKSGDACPVCGAIVDKELSDDSFIEALKPIEDKYRTDENRAEELQKAYLSVKAEYEASIKLAAKYTKAFNDAQKKCEGAKKVLAEKTSALGLASDDVTLELLCSLKEADDAKNKFIADRQKSIRDLRNSNDNLNSQINQITRDMVNDMDRKIDNDKREVDTLTKKRFTTSGQINQAAESVVKYRAKLASLINPEWKPENADNFFGELKTAAEQYEKAKKRCEQAHQSSDRIAETLKIVAESQSEIVALFPEFIDRDGPAPEAVANIGNVWSNLLVKCRDLADQIKSTRDAILSSETEISQFSELHPEIDMEAVKCLANIKGEVIKGVRDKIDILRNNEINAKSRYDAAVNHLDTIEVVTLEEGETLDTMKSAKSELVSKINVLHQSVGSLQKALDDDKALAESKADKIKELDDLVKECVRWKRLDKYLGSTGGKNFRTVAQSFIFSDLLDRANEYLSEITDRYRLKCYPGSLTVIVQDAYEGGAERPCNTNSGGESFIISLALALGLSSMQSKDFEVDTLFIDEGFGTLSPEYFGSVISTFKRLSQVHGRKVGIISHMEGLKSHIPAKIEVYRDGKSCSKVKITME